MKRDVGSILFVLAAVIAAGGAVTRAIGPRAWERTLRGTMDDRVQRTPSANTPATAVATAAGLAQEVVATDVFAARRSAPRAKYSADPVSEPVTQAVVVPAKPAVRLYGTGMTGGQATAILDADPAVPGAEIYHVGDALFGGGRVVSIEADHVVIETSRGRERLRMLRATKPPTSSAPEPP